MGKVRGLLLLLALGLSVSTAQASVTEEITNCAEVSAASPDDLDSTPGNGDFTQNEALFEDDESCVRVTKVIPYDYGDAPDPSFPTTEPSSGAKHLLSNTSTVYLGTCVDNDSGTLHGDATADDQNAGTYTFGTCTGTDDEDGVTFPSIAIGATGLSVDVVANDACLLNAWIDWNGDGDWDDAGEQIATDQSLVAGSNSVPLTLPAITKAGDVYSRFRCSTAGGDGYTGEALDGEVEDYRVTIIGTPNIEIKKYVQSGTGAPAFDIATSTTWGLDAQDADSAEFITYGDSALYTLIVENTGGIFLSDVQVDDAITNCDPLTKVYDSDASTDARPENVMAPGEIWAYQCSLPNVQDDITNIAEATGMPIQPPPADPADPLTPTGQTPPRDIDPAVTETEFGPAIHVKKYVMPAPTATATPLVEGDASTYGTDAQDNASAENITFGESATYRIRVENTGTTWLDSVVVDDRIEACDPMTKEIDTDPNTPDGVMSVGEVWWYECTLVAVQADETNIAVAEGRPVHVPNDPANPPATLDPTGQSPVDDDDPANTTTYGEPTIELKKYVQPATGASASITDPTGAWNATWGEDAQDNASAVNITYTEDAIYRIRVQNLGNTWLDNVVVDDQLAGCDPLTLVEDSDTNTPTGIMSPNEINWFECTQTNVTEGITNIATVAGQPVENPADPTNPGTVGTLTPTGQSPVNDDDPANVDTIADPRIELKKYVQPAPAAGWNPADMTTLGNDAQDIQSAEEIPYNSDAVYRITVTNTGATWLDSVAVDDLIDACTLAQIDNGDADANNLLAPNEMWVYECSLTGITDESITNTATVEARPVNEDGTPTGQSPVDDSDPANVVLEPTGTPSIAIKKYVQPATGAPTYDVADDTTLGQDAQSDDAAVDIIYGESALYRIAVTNTGDVHLSDVNPDDQIADCALTRIDPADTRIILSPGERWVYECQLDNVQTDITNIAKVNGTPVQPPVDPTDPATVPVPTGQTPPSDIDPAVVSTETQPSVSLKKYVMSEADAVATPLTEGVPASYGQDAQDNAAAVNISFGTNSVYRIRVMNTGTSWLDNVVVDDKIEACDPLNKVIDTDLNTPDGVMSIGEVWWFECTLVGLESDETNIATVEGTPVNVPADPANPPATLDPTGQSPVDDSDPANTTTYSEPMVELKKYVQPATGASASITDPTGAWNATWGEDAQDNASAVNITYTEDAIYRIRVQNLGNTWLDNVVVDDQLAGCDPLNLVEDSDANTSAGIMSPNEINWYECTQTNVTAGITNIATVAGQPVETPADPANPGAVGTLTPTGQSPVNDDDPANIDTTADPRIDLKKYVQPAPAVAWNPADVTTLGNDAQDIQSAEVIPYNSDVVYRISVTNTGATWLDTVVVDDLIDNCDPLTRIDNGDADANDLLAPSERWIYECGLTAITDETITNTAVVEARPVNEDGTPTGQSPVDDSDPANVVLEDTGTPGISIKKYVQPATGAPAYDAADDLTLGQDAQTEDASVAIIYGETALYRIVVTNTGNTHLADVATEDGIADCALSRIDPVDTRVVLSPGERWVYECQLANIQDDITNIAKVTGTPIEPPADPTDPNAVITPTGQTPPTDLDPAVTTTDADPAITLKKYVMDATTAIALVEGDPSTYGADAQDDRAALNITYGNNALYRIRVMNTGTSWLDNVVVDDRIEACDPLTKVLDSDAATPDGVMSVGEIWWFECTLPSIIEPVTNIAAVEGRPVDIPADPANPPATLSPTGQSPVDATDPANVTTYIGPAIVIKKYVQPATNAQVFDAADNTTWGADAQEDVSATNITYTEDALFRIMVENVGDTWLDNVVVDEQIADCAMAPIAGTTDSSDGFMSPGEIWWYECTLANITEEVTNTATVEGLPTHEDQTPTGQSPVNDTDPASVDTTADPRIELKKYVQPADMAPAWNPVDPSTLGFDAQDAQVATTIPYYSDALYRITVTNTGATWLDTVVVDDLIDACTLAQIDNGDGDANNLLAPNETWVYECTLPSVTDEALANVAVVEARPVNEDGSSRDQSPVDDSDPAHIKTGSYSIGNFVWIDDGVGNSTYANNGIYDTGEQPVPNGVQVELWNADGSMNIANTQTTDGYYLFHHLPAGEYRVCISSANFLPGSLLAAYGPSTGGNELDPNLDVDNNDNGEDDLQFGICSGTLNLGDGEPSGETPTDNGAAGEDGQGTADKQSNLTVDFAVIPSYSLGNQVWVDDGAGDIDRANNGVMDAGELPVDDTTVLELLDSNGNVVQTTNPLGGYYLFSNLAPDDYVVRIAASNFQSGGVLEGFQSCTHGNEADPNIGGDGNDNGIDSNPMGSGISTGVITLGDNEPLLESPTASGIDGNDGSNRPDSYTNLTVDLCVVKLTGIGNRVWVDESNPNLPVPAEINNSTFDNGEQPVANAEIQLFVEGADPEFDDFYAVTTTDSGGCYHFNDLPEGRYFVHIPSFQAVVVGSNVAALSAYVSSTGQGGDDGIDDDRDENGEDNYAAGNIGISSNVYELIANNEPTDESECGENNTRLADNSIDDTADFGLVSDLSLGDRIWIDGNANGIQDAEEHPLPGATVELVSNGNVVASTESDTNGNYLFEHLQPGDYIVRVTPPTGYRPTPVFSADPNIDNNMDSDCQFTGGSTAATGNITLTLAGEPLNDGDYINPNSNLTVDCGFYRPLAVGNFIWEDLNGNGMQYSGEPGLESFTVNLVNSDLTPVTDADGVPVASVVTGIDGAYIFDNLMPGEYIVQVTPPSAGYVLSPGGVTPDENPSDTDSNCVAADSGTGFTTLAFHLWNTTEPESTIDGDNTDRDMTVDCGFYRPVSIGHYVWIDTNYNGIQDSNEKPLAGAIVSLLDAEGNPAKDIFGNTVESQTTGEDGSYLFDNLASGDYIVNVKPPVGFDPTLLTSDDPNDNNNTDNNCAIVEGGVPGESQTGIITLLWGTESVQDGDVDPASNLTVGCGFKPQVFQIPTLSEWAYILLMLMLAGIAWRMRNTSLKQ